MSTRTVRLDHESERALEDIRETTGMSVSAALKRGLTVLRDSLRADPSRSPFDIYSSIDLGPGGYERAPARRAKQALRTILRRSRRR
jgi:hypothetical protein